jgi:tetratricopeptide (TPR) repeat protein
LQKNRYGVPVFPCISLHYYSTRAAKYYNSGDYNNAIPEYTSALKYSPKNESLYLNRGNAYFNLKKYDKAISDYNKVISINPNTSDAWNNRGRAYWIKGQNKKAVRDFEEACKMLGNTTACVNYQDIIEEKQSAEYFCNEANNYVYSRDYANAMKYFSTSINKDKNYYDSYIGRGKLYYIKEGGSSITGNHSQALNDFNIAISINPKRAEGYLERGKVYLVDDQYEAAINDYNKALSIDPNNGKAYYNRAQAFSNLLNANNQFKNSEAWNTCRADFVQSCNLGYNHACEQLENFNDEGYLYGRFSVDE